MKLGKVVSPAAIIIFGIVISIVFFLRASCEANELFHEPICDNTSAINIVFPELSSQNKVSYDRHDNKTAFESIISYFLEKHESSPPL